MKTYVKIWRDGEDQEPEILKSIETIKNGDMFQCVENLFGGPVLFAQSHAKKNGDGTFRIESDTIPF